MAAQGPPLVEAEAPQLVAQFPPPPFYFKLYRDVKESAENGEETEYEPPLPPKPIEGTYTMFGAVYGTEDVIPTLEQEGRAQLYPSGDANHIEQLNKLHISLMIKFLELLDYLVNEPSEYKSKVEDIELIMVNMYHLLNTYRPHQARQTLIAMMEEQIERRNKFIGVLQERTKEVDLSLESCLSSLKSSQEGSKYSGREEPSSRDQSKEDKMNLEEKQQSNETDLVLKMKSILDQIK